MFNSLKKFARELFDAILPPLTELPELPKNEQPKTESCDPKTIANQMRKTATLLNMLAEKLDPLMPNLKTQFGEPPKLENWNTIMPASKQIGKIKFVGTKELSRLRENTLIKNLTQAFDEVESQRGNKTIDLVKKTLEELKERQKTTVK